MKRGTDAEAELLGRVMPVITCDIFPPADILNRILSEFITARPTVAYSLTPTIFKVSDERKMYFYRVTLFRRVNSGLWNGACSRPAEFSSRVDPFKLNQFHPCA